MGKDALESGTYTRADIMRLMNISKSTVQRWEKAGYLKPVNPPGTKSTRYLKRDVHRLIEKGKNPDVGE